MGCHPSRGDFCSSSLVLIPPSPYPNPRYQARFVSGPRAKYPWPLIDGEWNEILSHGRRRKRKNSKKLIVEEVAEEERQEVRKKDVSLGGEGRAGLETLSRCFPAMRSVAIRPEVTRKKDDRGSGEEGPVGYVSSPPLGAGRAVALLSF